MDSAETILLEIERSKTKGYLPIIGPGRGKILDDAIRRSKAKRILEVGTLVGYSAIRMARLLPVDGSVTCVEVDAKMAKTAELNISRAGLSDRIRVLVGDARSVIPTLGGPFDMVFLDATKNQYHTYLKLVEDKLHRGSIVVADNAGVFALEMKDYLEYVRDSGKYSSEYFEPDVISSGYEKDGVEVSMKL